MSNQASSSDAMSDELSQHQEAMRTLLTRLHKQLVRRDVNDIFAKPVTDDIAPRYSEIITNPMDLSTMKSKIDTNQYANVADFRGDFRLMCQNAMTYNTPETIFYEAADKLMTEGDRLMAFDKLSQLRKQCGLAHRLSDDDLQATGARPRRHPHPQQQQLLARASPKSSPRPASAATFAGNRRRPAATATPPPPQASSSSQPSAASSSSGAAAGDQQPMVSGCGVPDDIFDSVVGGGGGEASNSGASHCSAVGAAAELNTATTTAAASSVNGAGDAADGEASGNSSSNMVVLMDEDGSEAGQIEIEELLADNYNSNDRYDQDEDDVDMLNDDRLGAPASYTDPTPIGELTALAEAAAAEARARLMSAGPPLVGRLEEPGLVFVPVDDYEDDYYYSNCGVSAAAAARADVKPLCRRQVLYPSESARLLGSQDSEQAALDQLTSRLLGTAGGPLLAPPSGGGDRVDAFLADDTAASSADLLGEVYGDRLALEYVLSVQSFVASCSRGQRRLVNKYFNLVTEGDHKRCEPIWRQFQRKLRQQQQRRRRRLQNQRQHLKQEFAEDEDDEDDDDEEEEDQEDQEDAKEDKAGDAKESTKAEQQGVDSVKEVDIST